jgi:hypothetical protein
VDKLRTDMVQSRAEDPAGDLLQRFKESQT